MKKELKQQLVNARNGIMVGIVVLIFIASAIALTEKRLSGFYSITPSFSTKVDYSFDSYAEISEIIKDLVEKCSDQPDDCAIKLINALDNKNYEFYFKHRGAAIVKEWPESCESKEADFFYDFIEFYTDCISTPYTDCRCEMALDRYFEGKATIKTSESVAVLTEKGFSEEVTAGFPADVVYNNKKASIGSLTGQSKIVIIKNKDGAPQIADQSTKEFPNLCKIDNRFFKACIVSKMEVLALNPSTGAVGKQNVTYRFAFETKNKPPKQVAGINVSDMQRASNRIIVRWNESRDTDLGKYAVYYSKTAFLTQNLNQCTPDSTGICTKVEISNNPTVIMEIDLSQLPVFDNGVYVYSYTNESGKSVSEPLLDKTLYQVKSAKGNYTFYVLEVPSNEKYYLAVTAIDLSGKEMDNTNEEGKLQRGMNYGEAVSIDDIAPGKVTKITPPTIKPYELSWDKSLLNIDGTLLDTNSRVDYTIYGIDMYEKQTEIRSTGNNYLPLTDEEYGAYISYKILPIKNNIYGKESPERDYLLEISTIV